MAHRKGAEFPESQGAAEDGIRAFALNSTRWKR
jgi:hypothetical protein